MNLSNMNLLFPPLTDEQRERHEDLIRLYFREIRGNPNPEINYHKNGAQKGVYKVKIDNEEFLAVAASNDKSIRLLTEYNVLSVLYNGAPEFFPRPVAHYAPENAKELGDLMVMQFLPHDNLADFDRYQYTKQGGFFRALAKEIGKSMAIVHHKTGRYSSEPHNGNILVKLNDNGDIDLKYCDAIQFLTGSLDDAVRQMLGNNKEIRGECYRFIKQFREGLASGVSDTSGTSYQDAWNQFDFMKEYNPIF